jgi:hypothetical protein
VTHDAKHQKYLNEVAKLHDAALALDESQLDHYRATFRQRLREASLRDQKVAGPATAANVNAGLVPVWAWWLAACGAPALVVLGILVQRHVRTPKSVEVSPDRSVAASSRISPASPAPAVSSVVRDPCVARVRAAGDKPLIDDFEDGNPLIAPFEERVGLWVLFKDTDSSGTFSTLTPSVRVPAVAKNNRALHVVGGELLDWGAVIQVAFQPSCYDASSYAGISFSAKGPGRIYAGMREVSVVPVQFGGTCTRDCYNSHQKKVDLSARWQTYTVLWSEMRQRGYSSTAIDTSRLNGLAFLIYSGDTPYDLWLDDVKFVKR